MPETWRTWRVRRRRHRGGTALHRLARLYISFCSYHEARLAETETNPLRRSLPDGIVPEDEVTRTEDRWIAIVLGMLGVMMAVIVVT